MYSPVCSLVSGLTTRGVVEVLGTVSLVVGAGVLAVVVVAAAVVGASHCWVLYGEKEWEGIEGGREGGSERERERGRERGGRGRGRRRRRRGRGRERERRRGDV